MAILQRPAEVETSHAVVRSGGQSVAEGGARSARAGARTAEAAAATRARRTRMLERLPMIVIGIVAALSVGYGIGTLVQFDRDWRDFPPELVTSVQGSVAEGTALGSAVSDILAANGVTVSDVQCADTAVAGGIDDLMCHARTDTGMVSIVASGPASALQVDVYTGA